MSSNITNTVSSFSTTNTFPKTLLSKLTVKPSQFKRLLGYRTLSAATVASRTGVSATTVRKYRNMFIG